MTAIEFFICSKIIKNFEKEIFHKLVDLERSKIKFRPYFILPESIIKTLGSKLYLRRF